MSIGAPALTTNARMQGAGGPPFPPAAADNGLSVAPAGEIVLGQNVGQAGNPAALLSNRQIPIGAFNTTMVGSGHLKLTQSNGADTGQQLQVEVGVRFENGFGGVIDMSSAPAAPTLILNTNAFVQVNGDNCNLQVGPVDMTFTAGSTGSFLWQVFAGVIAMTLKQNGHLLIGTTVDMGQELCVQGGIATADPVLIHSIINFGNGAGASLGTLTNAPTPGNPTKWVPIDDNGTARFIPAW